MIVAGYTDKVKIGMDAAASEFYGEGHYDLNFKVKNNDGSQRLTSDKLGDLYKEFIHSFPVVTVEDGFDQDDWDAWAK